MAKITKISSQKNSERANIYLDGVFSFGVKQDLIIAHNLYVGRELTDPEIAVIKKDDDLRKCLDKAYRYLSYRPRSEQEVRTKLSEKYEPGIVNKAIVKLKKQHYVDDIAFVNFWVEQRGNSRGPSLIASELRQKGIADQIISGTLEITSTEKMIRDALLLVNSKRKYQNLSRDEAYKKLAPFLARRGYAYDIIKAVINKNS